jgi:hypothetical protein
VTAFVRVLLGMVIIACVAAVVVEVVQQKAKRDGPPARHARDPKVRHYTRDHPPSLDEWAADPYPGPDERGRP